MRAPGSTSYADLKHSIMDVLLALPPETTIRPGHTDPTTVGDELESNRFVRIWRGEDPEDGRECTALGEKATLVLLGDDYDGGHKAWVRWPDGSRRHRPRLAGLASVRGMSREQSGGLSVTTLLIASGSAAAAAVIVPLFWDRGSLVAAAITPVIVALTSEGLKKPVEKIPTVGVWRKHAPGHRGPPARRPRLRGPRPRGGARRGRSGADRRSVRPA